MAAPSEPSSVARWARWALIVGGAAMAAIMVISSYLGYRSARAAARAAGRGEVEVVLDRVRQDLHRRHGPPSEADLAEIRDELASRGLRYLAFVAPQQTIAAGVPVGGPATFAPEGPPFVMYEVGHRLRAIAREPAGPVGPRPPGVAPASAIGRRAARGRRAWDRPTTARACRGCPTARRAPTARRWRRGRGRSW
ncbi:MAG: hypothetical protein H6708_15380 [Kofleriaceae bacterium]|nr:hypothetical protein [Kofleriaceae bacterium]